MIVSNENNNCIFQNINNDFQKDENVEETSFLCKKRLKSNEGNIENKIIQINDSEIIKSSQVKSEIKSIL